jgi:membrane associated rhomboid family serine protease
MFMHARWERIIDNMVFLWAFGPEVEDAMAHRRYLVFYLLGGLVSALAEIVADPTSSVPSLGARGAIAAVMGAFVIFKNTMIARHHYSHADPIERRKSHDHDQHH